MQVVQNEYAIFTTTLSESPHSKLKNFSPCYLWSFYQTRPSEILPSTEKEHWTVKGTQCYPTCSNSNAFRWLPPSWTEFSLLNTNQSWRVGTDMIHQKSITSYERESKETAMGRTFLISCLVAITASLVLWESIFLYFVRWLLLLHSFPTNLLTRKW